MNRIRHALGVPYPITQAILESAINCWWHDRVQCGLWKGIACFNDLPQDVRILYFQEAQALCQH